MLSDRRQLVLRALIEEYVNNALPVGSRTLFEHYDLGCSSATIRSELSRLEDEGFLRQPHTSAGRIPTDQGYRVFVDDLLSHLKVSASDQLEQVRKLKEAAQELDDLFEQTSLALTKLTDCLALVLPPRMLAAHVKVVNLVPMSPSRLVMVVVTTDGSVLNRTITLPMDVAADAVARLQERLNDFISQGAVDVSSANAGGNPHVSPDSEPLLAFMLKELSACLSHQPRTRPYQIGMANLMTQPEFSASASLLPVLSKLEDDTILLQVYEDAVRHEGPLVRIGHENGSEALNGVSVVASHFGSGDQMGVVAILGPTRMNYSQVLSAVQAAKKALGDS